MTSWYLNVVFNKELYFYRKNKSEMCDQWLFLIFYFPLHMTPTPVFTWAVQQNK